MFLTVVLKLGLDSALLPEIPKAEPEQPVRSICQKDLGYIYCSDCPSLALQTGFLWQSDFTMAPSPHTSLLSKADQVCAAVGKLFVESELT